MSALHKKLLPIYTILLIVTVLCANNIFFWDTYQLCGKQAWALYENGLLNWILPQEIDSGHPPLFGFYHATLWKIFGPNLIASHLAMLPFLLGIVYYLFKIGIHFQDETKAKFLILLLLADPVFMGQAVLASPDIFLLFFMLLCLHAVLSDLKFYRIIGSLGLGLISMRGMMVLLAIILFDFLYEKKYKSKTKCLATINNYIPSLATVFFFLAQHYMHTGWIGHHPESSWAASFEIVGKDGLIKNIVVLGWRVLDFGRVFLLLPLLYLGYRYTQKVPDKIALQLFILFTLISAIILPILVAHRGLVLHRYLLPIFVLMHILFWYLLMKADLAPKIKKYTLAIVLSGLFLGNLWVYPKKISQGWDATLGHLPYYHLRKKMNTYIDQENIPFHRVGTAFPNIGDMRNFDPMDLKAGMEEYDFEKQDYIFYSNVYNDFSDQEIDILDSDNWSIEQEYHFYPICVILYKKEQ